MWSIYLLFPIIVGIIGLAVVFWLRKWVLDIPIEVEKTREVSEWIKTGARAFLKREYVTISYFIIGISIVLGALAYLGVLGWEITLGFIVGSVLSLFMAWIGMETATDANVRTTNVARKDALGALKVAFRGGAVTGLSLISLAVLGISLLYIVAGHPSLIVGFGFGASLAALFAQLGGGIYTKSADIGADLVGKVEQGLEEDDPKNAAVIADQVGDNVGDCAGRASDLFESFSDNIISIMIIGAFLALYTFKDILSDALPFILLPLVLQAIGIIAVIIGVFSIIGKDPTKSIYLSFMVTGIIIVVGFSLAIELMIGPEAAAIGDPTFPLRLIIASIVGLVGSLLTVLGVIYFTGHQYGPVKDIAKSAKGGPAIDVLAGLSYGMESSFPEAIIIGIVIAISFFIAAGSLDISGINGIKGIYGVAIAGLGLLGVTGIIQTSDTFGPIVDNADGIATMAGIGDEVGTSLETLDAVGNMTKALTKAYGMAAAILTAISMLFAYIVEAVDKASIAGVVSIGVEELAKDFDKVLSVAAVNMLHPLVIVGVLIGAAVPFLFSAWALKGAQSGAFAMVAEVRRQFKENPGILEGKTLPDYGKAVDIATRYALIEMIMPTLLGLFMPILIGVLIPGILSLWVLAGYLASLNIVAALLAIFQFNAGGALDNAKKVIEISGRKHTPEHEAAVVGDTVGDPLKDTAGPSLHILIKLSNILSITLVPLYVALVEIGNYVYNLSIAIGVLFIWVIIWLFVRHARKKYVSEQ
ncbi:MAG: sodium-translocating pyrophosphatase [Candidatus Njordarchaeia archaeon]